MSDRESTEDTRWRHLDTAWHRVIGAALGRMLASGKKATS